MEFFFFFVISFLTSIVGSICGIGGGVIMKPVIDAFQILDVTVISFLSGCTVLSMSAYSVARNVKSGNSQIDQKVSIPLALGAAVGGLLGKWLFSLISMESADLRKVGAVQSGFLLFITLGALLYTIFKSRIVTWHITNKMLCILAGLFLGVLSSFLGIGGGPINLILLSFLFSMETKAAVENSLYIILISQIASLIAAIWEGNVPDFNLIILVFLVLGGILGGGLGRTINGHITERIVDKLFILLLFFIILINLHNFQVFTIGGIGK